MRIYDWIDKWKMPKHQVIQEKIVTEVLSSICFEKEQCLAREDALSFFLIESPDYDFAKYVVAKNFVRKKAFPAYATTKLVQLHDENILLGVVEGFFAQPAVPTKLMRDFINADHFNCFPKALRLGLKALCERDDLTSQDVLLMLNLEPVREFAYDILIAKLQMCSDLPKELSERIEQRARICKKLEILLTEAVSDAVKKEKQQSKK